jgi:hypothetical protein
MPSNSDQVRTLSDELLEATTRVVIAWRVELCLLTVPAGLGAWLYFRSGPVVAIVIPVLVVLAAVVPPPLRRLIGRTLHRASVRRHLDIAYASVPGILSERPPIVGTVTRTPFGDRVALGLRHGTSFDDLVRSEGVVAASLGVRDVRAIAEASRKNCVTLSITRRDPFESAAVPSPLIREERMNAWNPIPVGLDEEGRIVFLSLVEHNLLIGGEPGAGKSVGLSGVVAAFALDPNVDLWLFDGKLVELAPWRTCAERFVGPDVEAAISALEALREVMAYRYGQLLDRGVRKVSIGDHLRLQLVVIDEMALYVAGVDKKMANRFSELLRDLVARGRAAGIIVVAATQKPSIDIVPSALRDLFGFRWAFRCATRDASDTVLGSGWASQGFSTADIDPSLRGVSLAIHEGGVPVRLRTFHLTDAVVSAIAERARQRRAGKPEGPGS